MTWHGIVRFHEIALKGRNRPFFTHTLMENIKKATQDIGVKRVRLGHMMVVLILEETADTSLLKERLGKVFGVNKFALARRLPPSLEEVENFLSHTVPGLAFHSFRITAKREDHSFPQTTPEIQRRLGSLVQKLSGAEVNLTQPELNIFVDVLPREVFVYFEEIPGPGGLPVGVSGQVISLLSGGIDSPVAAWYIMKRGCQVSFVHFHSFPLVDRSSIDKVMEITQLLTRYQYHSRLFLVPFAPIQKHIIVSVPASHRIVLYRRFMARIAEAIAREQGAKALVTGESLGQVSSQTLDNLATIEAVVRLPVLRPLIGMDKLEIVAEAQRLGTYPVSILPDQDCCRLFVPRHPVIRSRQEEVEGLEARLEVEELVQQALASTEVREFSFPG
jgi:thiamine biosynthesis protein ThiI